MVDGRAVQRTLAVLTLRSVSILSVDEKGVETAYTTQPSC